MIKRKLKIFGLFSRNCGRTYYITNRKEPIRWQFEVYLALTQMAQDLDCPRDFDKTARQVLRQCSV